MILYLHKNVYRMGNYGIYLGASGVPKGKKRWILSNVIFNTNEIINCYPSLIK